MSANLARYANLFAVGSIFGLRPPLIDAQLRSSLLLGCVWSRSSGIVLTEKYGSREAASRRYPARFHSFLGVVRPAHQANLGNSRMFCSAPPSASIHSRIVVYPSTGTSHEPGAQPFPRGKSHVPS